MGPTEISLLTFALLIGAAFLAGLVDAVVGGGGLIQLPALLIGLPPDISTARVCGTNKLSSVAGTAMATGTYARKVRYEWPTALATVTCAGAGSAVGAQAVHIVPRQWFTPIVLVVVIVVGLYTLRRPALGLSAREGPQGLRRWVSAAGLGGVVGLWDGLIGPGTGILFIITFVTVLGMGFLEASAYGKLANFVTNLGAIAVFWARGNIWWELGLCMAAANLTGGFLGAHLALRRGNRFVRRMFLVVASVLALKLAWDTGLWVLGGLR